MGGKGAHRTKATWKEAEVQATVPKSFINTAERIKLELERAKRKRAGSPVHSEVGGEDARPKRRRYGPVLALMGRSFYTGTSGWMWMEPTFAWICMLSAEKGEGVGLEEVTGDSFLGGCLLVFSVSTR